jgi:hypothetical protein
MLTSGWQQETISFSATNGDGQIYTEQVPVKVYFSQVEKVVLPIITR